MTQGGNERLPRFGFSGLVTFLGAPAGDPDEEFDADIAVVGVPFDEGSPYMPGSRFGPRSIREHSLRFLTGESGYFDPVTGTRFLEPELRNRRIVDLGDAEILPTNPRGSFDRVTEIVARVVQRGAMPVVLGGDHSITFPVVRAFSSQELHVFHLDAHLDYMPFVHGMEFTNQHAFRHITKMDHVASLTQVGIRSIRNSERMLVDSRSDGNRVVTMGDVDELGCEEVARVLPAGAPTYVSIDIDVLDMSLTPGCVSAEPEGLTYGQLRKILFTLADHVTVIGFDLVEVNPQLDVRTGVTSYLGAHTVIEFLGHIRAATRTQGSSKAGGKLSTRSESPVRD